MAQEHVSDNLNILLRLSFPITLKDGQVLRILADGTGYVSKLPAEKRDETYWRNASRMLNIALEEPSYLKAATMSLQSALMLEGVLVSPHPLDAD